MRLKRLGAVAVVVATVTVLGSGCAIVGNSVTSNEPDAGRSIDIERGHESATETRANVDGGALQGNPSERSFGTLQEDGSYCGVTCFENH